MRQWIKEALGRRKVLRRLEFVLRLCLPLALILFGYGLAKFLGSADPAVPPWLPQIGMAGSLVFVLVGIVLFLDSSARKPANWLQTLNQELSEKVDALEKEVKGREKALEDSRAASESLVETLPVIFWRKDREGHFTFANALCCEWFATTKDQIIGKTDHSFHPPSLTGKIIRDDRRVLETGEVFEDLEWLRKKDGKRVFVHVIKSPVYDSQGAIIGTQGCGRDITDAKKKRKRLSFILKDDTGSWSQMRVKLFSLYLLVERSSP